MHDTTTVDDDVPGMTSMPQCWYDDKLDSVRKPIDRRPGLLAEVQTVGEDARIRCNQSRFVETWVISTRKSLVEGSISTSEYGKAAWQASGSVKHRTLLQATLGLSQRRKIGGYTKAGKGDQLVRTKCAGLQRTARTPKPSPFKE